MPRDFVVNLCCHAIQSQYKIPFKFTFSAPQTHKQLVHRSHRFQALHFCEFLSVQIMDDICKSLTSLQTFIPTNYVDHHPRHRRVHRVHCSKSFHIYDEGFELNVPSFSQLLDRRHCRRSPRYQGSSGGPCHWIVFPSCGSPFFYCFRMLCLHPKLFYMPFFSTTCKKTNLLFHTRVAKSSQFCSMATSFTLQSPE